MCVCRVYRKLWFYIIIYNNEMFLFLLYYYVAIIIKFLSVIIFLHVNLENSVIAIIIAVIVILL